MKYISIILIIIFYIFFFLRAYLLQKKTGKPMRGNARIYSLSVFFACLSNGFFILQKVFIFIEQYSFVLVDSLLLEITGTVLIAVGLLLCIIASINLGKSWRIGFNTQEKTILVTSGIYGISRNPYYLSYDVVLIGLMLSSMSLLVIIPSIITISIFHVVIIKEEKYLEDTLGKIYLEYKKKVRRYI